MEDKESPDEKAPIANEKKKQPDHVVSKRQMDHLAYAREMKRLKADKNKYDAEVQSRNLDFINQRLTSIEEGIHRMIDADKTTAKRKRRVSKKLLPDDEDSDELEKPKKKTSEKNKPLGFDYAGWIPYAGKFVFVGTGAFLMSLFRNLYTRQTSDGDTIGNYYVGKDI